MTILVVGSTGRLGKPIASRCLENGYDTRILVRPATSYGMLQADGAQPIMGDLKNRSSLDEACRNVDVVITTANSAQRGGDDNVDSVDLKGNRELVDAAAAAGVKQFIFTSAMGSATDSPVPFMRAKAATEQHLRDSGMKYTILSPNIFMDVWVSAVVDEPLRAGKSVTLVGKGRTKHSFVAAADVAEFAVKAINRAAALDEVITIGGPRPVSWTEIVAAYEVALGRPIPVVLVPPGSSVPGLPDFMSGMLSSMEGFESPVDSQAAADKFGVTLTPIESFVRESIARWR